MDPSEKQKIMIADFNKQKEQISNEIGNLEAQIKEKREYLIKLTGAVEALTMLEDLDLEDSGKVEEVVDTVDTEVVSE
jgi:hypothetical protein